jgi:hypothetical protein
MASDVIELLFASLLEEVLFDVAQQAHRSSRLGFEPGEEAATAGAAAPPQCVLSTPGGGSLKRSDA